MTAPSLALVLSLVAAQLSGQTAGTDTLTEAKQLYAAGAYEDALTRLSGNPRRTPEVDQYRALCLLALGRTAEVDRSLEELVGRDPLFKMSDTDVSPRLLTIFHNVRRRLLPETVKRLYADAKQSFEDKRYDSASAQFKDLLGLLADEDLVKEAATVADIKMLAEGFMKLADAEVKASAVAAAAAAAPAAPPPAPIPAQPEAPKVYSIEDPDVVAPVALARAFPAWNPRTAAERTGGYEGLLRIVIDEVGGVETAMLINSVFPSYDRPLLDAARTWRFRPATKDGKPVKYRLTLPVVLSASGAR